MFRCTSLVGSDLSLLPLPHLLGVAVRLRLLLLLSPMSRPLALGVGVAAGRAVSTAVLPGHRTIASGLYGQREQTQPHAVSALTELGLCRAVAFGVS